VANGVVYIGSDDFSVYALNAKTGSELWSYATGNEVLSSPAIVNGVVYVGSVDFNIYAFGDSSLDANLRDDVLTSGFEDHLACSDAL
jgi:outer membrane protein assembly factor BamB